MKKFYCAVLLASACLILRGIGPAEAQFTFERLQRLDFAEITGTLQCGPTPDALSGVLVFIAGTSHIAITDLNGDFILRHVLIVTEAVDITVEIPGQAPETILDVPLLSGRRTVTGTIVFPSCPDADGDGFTIPADCDDNNASINPGATEVCDGVDNNCDGQVDEAFDLNNDVSNCGACGIVCSFPNATSTCSGGTCQFQGCQGSFADCNNDTQDGCEVDIASDLSNCGACGIVCSLDNATAACTGGSCQVASCSAGFGNCDFISENGCETDISTDVNNCGVCGNSCITTPSAVGQCESGSCETNICAPGLLNCDLISENGCETNISTDVNNCGFCGVVCAANESCIGGVCQ